MNIKIVEFYNTGVCEHEPKTIAKFEDPDDVLKMLMMELHNLEHGDCIEVRIKEITQAEWEEANESI